VTPTFYQGAHVGFFACTAHIVDIGGRGFGADANSVYEEGLHIPIMKFAERGEVDKTLLHIVRNNVREPDQLVGDMYALATCNEIGLRRLTDMMSEFGLDSLQGASDFILDNSRRATLERINALDTGVADGEMQLDGYSAPITLKVQVRIEKDRVVSDFEGSSGLDKKGINCPLVYTKAYACYALKCAIAPEIPNNAASLEPFVTRAPENSIVNAPHPAPVALRHIVGHMVPDTVYAALDQLDATAPDDAVRAEVLTFNSGGSGARPTLDGMNATAFPSGVMTMPVEATEQVGPVIIWRKELRADSGGAGEHRGGLGQYMDVGVHDGHEFHIQAMFDRVDHPARGRQGGGNGAPTHIAQDDGTPMRGKGKQFVPHGRHVRMAFPGGAGYGDPANRSHSDVARDLALGYISADTARSVYGLSDTAIDSALKATATGDLPA